jgi:hypothetical protein
VCLAVKPVGKPDAGNRLVRVRCGAAYSRMGDTATGDFGDATVIRNGNVPDDLSAL